MKFTINNNNELIILNNVLVQGQNNLYAKLDLILDTGANLTILPPLYLKQLGYDLNDLPTIMIKTANGSISAKRLKIKAMKLIKEKKIIVAENVDVLAYKIPDIEPVKGLLGISFLKHFNTLLALRDGYIEIN